MHARNSIISLPLLGGIGLSVALHGAALYSPSTHTPPQPTFNSGRTAVHLTLLPSRLPEKHSKAKTQTYMPASPIAPPPASIPLPQAASPSQLSPDVPTFSLPETSPPQEARLIEEKGVVTTAHSTQAIHPTYPRRSRRRGEEGTVALSVEVLADGTVSSVALVRSSGHRRLDESALQAARQAPFTPAQKLGRNIDSITELSFTFHLTDD